MRVPGLARSSRRTVEGAGNGVRMRREGTATRWSGGGAAQGAVLRVRGLVWRVQVLSASSASLFCGALRRGRGQFAVGIFIASTFRQLSLSPLCRSRAEPEDGRTPSLALRDRPGRAHPAPARRRVEAPRRVRHGPQAAPRRLSPERASTLACSDRSGRTDLAHTRRRKTARRSSPSSTRSFPRSSLRRRRSRKNPSTSAPPRSSRSSSSVGPLTGPSAPSRGG